MPECRLNVIILAIAKEEDLYHKKIKLENH
jgi:hypothetical protein